MLLLGPDGKAVQRDTAVVRGLLDLGGETAAVQLETLVAHLRAEGYRTPRDGSLVDVVGFVCNWLANRPHEIREGYTVRRTIPDFFTLRAAAGAKPSL
ncbi:MAG: hypothetical protein OXJ54_07345 [Gemmatimonadetes bacterium]|nr:hypothetical protein [Candidatus Palauibacter rhopaloidicola]